MTQPMDVWKWQNVVAFIEANEELRHLASVFWQYRIDGRELCKMGSKQIELLVECSMINNHNIIESDFDFLKDRAKSRWQLEPEAEALVHYKDKTRILSHVIAKYHLAMDTVHEVTENVRDTKRYHEFYQDAAMIADTIQILRANPLNGSKLYWKIDSYFFDKIDNFLSILICDDLIREMYSKCVYDFLIVPDKPPSDYVDEIMKDNKLKHDAMKSKSPLSVADDSFFGSDNDYQPTANARARNSMKIITSQLTLVRFCFIFICLCIIRLDLL